MNEPPPLENRPTNAELQAQVDRLTREVESLKRQSLSAGPKPVRRRSQSTVAGLPWYDIALGPDFERGERRGSAKGIIAIGDIACGVLAIGGFACGLLSIGGIAFGLLGALGGIALGGFTMGGVALGAAAFGGVAIGYYALGGVTIGAEPLKELLQHFPGR